jgi:solute carrier family 36 (proton-coupled amino acid transporter)
MSSPSKPVSIKSPRLIPTNVPESLSVSHVSPVGTPDLRAYALRTHYIGTPPPNIPPRGTSTAVVTPARTESPLIAPSDSVAQPHRQHVGLISAEAPASGLVTPIPFDLDDLPDEEKAKVLRRHLVSKDERLKQAEGTSNTGDLRVPSQPASVTGRRQQRREDTELFPVPYDTPGADVTCAPIFI